jgi:hypothetical protein
MMHPSDSTIIASSFGHDIAMGRDSSIIVAVLLTVIHAFQCLSKRTKTEQAGQTAKHVFISSKQTKRAGQTDTSTAQYGSKQANPLLWQFTFDGCSSSPYYPFKSLTDDCSLSPSISPSKQAMLGQFISPLLWQFASFKSLEQTDDCSFSPSIISQFQTEANLHLLSTTEVTDDPTSPSSPTTTEASVNLPLRLTATTVADRSTATVADLPPLRSSTATVAGPPRRPTSTASPTAVVPLR